MKNNNLSKLVETKEFQELINSFNLVFKIYKGSIILSNGYIYIYIYGYITEDCVYFTIFDIQNELYCFDIGRIEYDLDKSAILEIYNYHKKNHIKTITCNDGDSVVLLIEARFLTKIEILKKCCSDLLEGKMEKYKKYFEPMSQGYRIIFDEINALFDGIL
jgi:hypothetical protein